MYIEGSEWLPTLQNVKVDVSTQRLRLTDKKRHFNSFHSSTDFCGRLLITFANRLDPDQDRQNIGPGLDPNYLTL